MWIKVNPTTSLVEAVACCYLDGMTDEVTSVPDDLLNDTYSGIQQYYYIYNEFIKKTDAVIGDECFCLCDDETEDERFFHSFGTTQDASGYTGYSLGNTGSKNGSFMIPCNFDHLHGLYLMCRPQITGAGKSITMSSSYATCGEQDDTHTETENGLTFDLVSGEIAHIDVSPVFNDIAHGDVCGITIGNFTGVPLPLLGIKMIYHKTTT